MSNPSSANWTTNVNRAKTKRWVEAKTYNYDGDDWGDVDEYGEYDEPAAAAPKPTGLRKATAPASTSGPGQAQDMTGRERSNSFGQGDERRAFSGPPTRTAYAQPQPATYQHQVPSPSELSQPQQWPTNTSQAANISRVPDSNVSTGHDSRATTMSSISAAAPAPVGRRQVGQADMPAALNTMVPPPAIGQDREKPTTPTFIRPADIYRRMAEEREKERLSQDSSRPSLSGLTRDESPAGKSDNSGKSGRQAQYTAPVAAPSPFNPNTDIARGKGLSNSPLLPEIGGLSGFGDDFGGSFMSSSTAPATTKSTILPETTKPLAAQSTVPASSSGTQQESTLQHQPSTGYKTVVNRAFADAVPPTPSASSDSEMDRSDSVTTSQISPIISREVSSAVRPEGMSNIASIAEEPAGSSRPGTAGTATKQPQADLSSNTPPAPLDTNSKTPIVDNASQHLPAVATTPQTAKSQQVETATASPSSATPSGAGVRSSSPSKTRVRDLVDQIDSANNSRRGSQASLGEQATTPQAQRPTFEPKESFRPSIPGGWQSYTTNPPPGASSPRQQSPAKTAAKSSSPITENDGDAFTKAAAAGSALAGAFAAAAGAVVSTVTGDNSESQSEPEQPKRASKVDTAFHPEAARLPLPRQESDVASSIMPTPLEMKPQSGAEPEYFNTVQPLQQKQPSPVKSTLDVPEIRSTDVADDMSTRSSLTDLESDRLRKEIVRELSPQRDEPVKEEPDQPQDEAYDPAIYDSYLTEDDALSRNPSEANALDKAKTAEPVLEAPTSRHKPHDSTVPVFSSTSGPLEDIPMPMTATTDTDHSLTRQFSWEGPTENLAASLGTGHTAEKQAPHELYSPVESEKPQLSISTPTSHQRTVSQPLDVSKQLPLPAAPPAVEQENSQASPRNPTPPQHLPHQDSSETIQQAPVLGQKVPAFREIMAIQSTQQRIKTYDQTRQTFANMDTGLMQWIQATVVSLPEHEDVVRSGGIFPVVARPIPVGGAQSKPQLQSSISRPSLGPGKSVKGKDLLASAGVFGGKANSAAKGLFAKGKSKWGRSADKGFKRFRGPSIGMESDPANRLYDQRENLWETDASAPNFVTQPLHRLGSKDALKDALSDSAARQGSVGQHPGTTALPFTASPLPLHSASMEEAPATPTPEERAFERKRASHKRLSMDTPRTPRIRGHRSTSSMDSHRYGPKSRNSLDGRGVSGDLQARLTIHQNQMRSFGEEFPADLIIPAQYRVSTQAEKTTRAGETGSTEQTPTQASFPAQLGQPPKRSSPAALWLDTTGSTQTRPLDSPASPDYVVDPTLPADSATKSAKASPGRPDLKHMSLSFIQFDPLPSENLALKNPITPRRHSFHRERSDSDTAASLHDETQVSESSFADYPAPEQFGALPSVDSSSSIIHDEHDQVIPRASAEPSEVSMQNTSNVDHDQATSKVSHVVSEEVSRGVAPMPTQSSHDIRSEREQSRSSASTKSRNSLLERAARRLSRHTMEPVAASPPDPAKNHDEGGDVRDSVEMDSNKAYKRHSMLSAGESLGSVPGDQQTQNKRNRRSLLGLGLTLKNSDGTTNRESRTPLKFAFSPGLRKRATSDTREQEITPVKPVVTAYGDANRFQRASTAPITNEELTPENTPAKQAYYGGSKKGRFAGLNSFMNKARPRFTAVGNSIRGRSTTPMGTGMDPRLQDPAEYEAEPTNQPPRMEPLVENEQRMPSHDRSASQQSQIRVVEREQGAQVDQQPVPIADSGPLAPPQPHIRNAASIPDIPTDREILISKSTAPREAGEDYKSVYPPEFFGEQPPEGYYSPEDEPEASNRTRLPPNVSGSKTTATVPTTGAGNSIPKKTIRAVEQTTPLASQTIQHDDPAEDSDAPPPPPPKDPPKYIVTTTTTTSHKARKPSKTITTVEHDGSQQAQYEACLRGRLRDVSTTGPTITTETATPISPPTMHTALTRTVTRLENGRSVSPRPRDNRSSITPVAPLKIHKKSASVQSVATTSDGNIKVPEQQSDSRPGTGNRGQTPVLSVDTQTGPVRPEPVQQHPAKPVGSETEYQPPAGPPPAKQHPFMAARRASSNTQNVSGPKKQKSHSRSASGLSQRISAFPTSAGRVVDVPPERDPAMTVKPLSIRKSPSIGTAQSVDSIEDSAFDPAQFKGIATPAVQRASVYSAVLSDSPTLPKTTPPSSSIKTSAAPAEQLPPIAVISPIKPEFPRSAADEQKDDIPAAPPAIADPASPKQSLTPTMPNAIAAAIVAAQATIHAPTAQSPPSAPLPSLPMKSQADSAHQDEPLISPPIISPLPTTASTSNDKAAIERSMTPVEKMKDEPRASMLLGEKDEAEGKGTEEEKIVMYATAMPGQQWRPDYGYGGWDGFE